MFAEYILILLHNCVLLGIVYRVHETIIASSLWNKEEKEINVTLDLLSLLN